MDTKDLAGLSDGQVIDEAADSIKLLAKTTGARPEYYRNLIARLRGIAVAVEMRESNVIGPEDFKKAYDQLGGAPDSLNQFVEVVKGMKFETGICESNNPDIRCETANQMPPPDNKEPMAKNKGGRPRKVTE